jgi:hypothetical protein
MDLKLIQRIKLRKTASRLKILNWKATGTSIDENPWLMRYMKLTTFLLLLVSFSFQRSGFFKPVIVLNYGFLKSCSTQPIQIRLSRSEIVERVIIRLARRRGIEHA